MQHVLFPMHHDMYQCENLFLIVIYYLFSFTEYIAKEDAW